MQLNIQGAFIKLPCNEVGREKVRVIKPKQHTKTHTHTHTHDVPLMSFYLLKVYIGEGEVKQFFKRKIYMYLPLGWPLTDIGNLILVYGCLKPCKSILIIFIEQELFQTFLK